MIDPQPLPLGLATMPPLTELAAVLADLSPDAVGGYDTVEVMRAVRRLKNAVCALESTWVTEVAVRRPGSVSTVERLQVPHSHAVDEIRAGLGLSVTSAGKLLSASWDATRRLPELRETMASGGLDEKRAEVFADWTGELSGEHAHAVVAELLPRAVLDAEEQLPAHLLKETGKELVRWTGQVPATTPSAPAQPTRARKAEPPMAGVQLRIRMTTLLGLDRAPAELAGWTPTHPDYALDLMPLMSAAQWRYALTDDDGHLIGSGLIFSRPKSWRRRAVRHRGVVDILVPASLLRDLVLGPLDGIELVDPDQFRTWHPVLVELAERMRNPKPLPDDTHCRMPGRGLRRAIELDKPRCIGVGCGRSSRRSEIDHRIDHALGGPTIDINLEPACGRDHGLKTKGGWTLHTWKNKGYRWCTPLGRHYIVTVPPVIENIPAAVPDMWVEDHHRRPDPDADVDHEGIPWQVSKIWHPTGPHPPPAVDMVHTPHPATTTPHRSEPPTNRSAMSPAHTARAGLTRGNSGDAVLLQAVRHPHDQASGPLQIRLREI